MKKIKLWLIGFGIGLALLLIFWRVIALLISIAAIIYLIYFFFTLKKSRNSFTRDDEADIFARSGNRCVNCGISRNLRFHHVVPLRSGGHDAHSNIVVLCHECHMKANKKVYTTIW